MILAVLHNIYFIYFYLLLSRVSISLGVPVRFVFLPASTPGKQVVHRKYSDIHNRDMLPESPARKPTGVRCVEGSGSKLGDV